MRYPNATVAVAAAMILGCSSAEKKPIEETRNDFDKICDIYTDLEKHPEAYPSSPSERAVRISEKVENAVTSSEAINTWKAISHASPQQKYELFQRGAEDTLKRNWECPALKRAWSGDPAK